MSLIHPALIYAAGLAVIPVILHFLLRAKPRKLIFPALRLILVRRRQNVRRLRLRHVWLLLLRMLVIVGLAVAAARPSLPEASYELSTRELVTLIAIVAAASGTYFGLTRAWRRKRLSVQTMAYRRTLLRGGLGVGVAALIALMVILPYVIRLRAEISAPAPAVSSDLPVAAVFLFDTSLSMQYTQEGKTRLDQAKAIALGHMESLPPRSRIAVGETNSTAPILFQADLVGAKSKIQALAPQPVTQPLNERLRAALALQQQDQGRTLDEQQSIAKDARRDRFIREVYVFTDLAATAWRTSGATLLKEELDRTPWVAAYVIDVGETHPKDVGITEVLLSRQSVPDGGTLTIDATLSAIGVEESERTVELSLQSRDGKLVKQRQQPVKIGGQTGAKVRLPVENLQGPVQHGELRLLSSDPLLMNDVRYFTVEVKPPPNVLLVFPSLAVGDYLKEALAPPGLEQAGKARYRVTGLLATKLGGTKLSDYSVVVLNSVPAPSDATWKSLHKYVSNGGGLAVFLGSAAIGEAVGIDQVAYNSNAAKSVLPAELVAPLSFKPTAALDLKNLNHPALKKLEEFGGAGELANVDIRRFWKTQPYDGTNVLIPYSDEKAHPALIERRVGAGRVAMLTTAADLRGWNELPHSWAFVVFADQLMQYLSGRNESTFNYLGGEEITLRA
ncbi:MAG TPA: BatA domain-containing protein, partial [Planctomycetaceae bacterium]|nr:BatA domain-containing protein [Planctomycetaceae bacterium]